MRTLRRRSGRVVAFLVWATVAAQDTQADLERRAGDAFAKNDCAAASKLYRSALELSKSASYASQASRQALYHRRIGICAYRVGDMDTAWNSYQDGVVAAESAKDHDLLFENLHGLALALRHLGRLTAGLEIAQREFSMSEACG